MNPYLKKTVTIPLTPEETDNNTASVLYSSHHHPKAYSNTTQTPTIMFNTQSEQDITDYEHGIFSYFNETLQHAELSRPDPISSTRNTHHTDVVGHLLFTTRLSPVLSSDDGKPISAQSVGELKSIEIIPREVSEEETLASNTFTQKKESKTTAIRTHILQVTNNSTKSISEHLEYVRWDQWGRIAALSDLSFSQPFFKKYGCNIWHPSKEYENKYGSLSTFRARIEELTLISEHQTRHSSLKPNWTSSSNQKEIHHTDVVGHFIITRLSPVISSEDDILTDRKWETHSSQSLEEEDETFLDDLLYITEALLLENEEEPGIRFDLRDTITYICMNSDQESDTNHILHIKLVDKDDTGLMILVKLVTEQIKREFKYMYGQSKTKGEYEDIKTACETAIHTLETNEQAHIELDGEYMYNHFHYLSRKKHTHPFNFKFSISQTQFFELKIEAKNETFEEQKEEHHTVFVIDNDKIFEFSTSSIEKYKKPTQLQSNLNNVFGTISTPDHYAYDMHMDNSYFEDGQPLEFDSSNQDPNMQYQLYTPYTIFNSIQSPLTAFETYEDNTVEERYRINSERKEKEREEEEKERKEWNKKINMKNKRNNGKWKKRNRRRNDEQQLINEINQQALDPMISNLPNTRYGFGAYGTKYNPDIMELTIEKEKSFQKARKLKKKREAKAAAKKQKQEDDKKQIKKQKQEDDKEETPAKGDNNEKQMTTPATTLKQQLTPATTLKVQKKKKTKKPRQLFKSSKTLTRCLNKQTKKLKSVNNRKIEGTQETFQPAIDPDISITTHRF